MANRNWADPSPSYVHHQLYSPSSFRHCANLAHQEEMWEKTENATFTSDQIDTKYKIDYELRQGDMS